MCGIFAYNGIQSAAAQLVFDGLRSLEYRGYDSWGVAAIGTTGIIIKKRIGKLRDGSVREIPNTHVAIGHTRWATHGGVSERNAHPHLSCDGSIALVHNGIVENYSELKNELCKKGHQFSSETDSEVIVHLLEEERRTHDLPIALKNTFGQLRGSNAVVVLEKGSNTVGAVTSGSPLIVGHAKHEVFFASDPAAIYPYTSFITHVEDGTVVICHNKKLAFIDVQTGKKMHLKFHSATAQVQTTSKGSFSHYMLKEIHEQPDLLRLFSKNDVVDFSGLQKIALEMKQAKKRYVVGCGSSYYLAQMAQYFLAQAGMDTTPLMGSEFLHSIPPLTKHDYVLVLSQSGETMDCIVPVKEALKSGAAVGALVNVQDSTLYRLATTPVLIHAGQEKAVASTKAFCCTLAHVHLLSKLMGGEKPDTTWLTEVASSTEKVFSKKVLSVIKKCAAVLKNKQQVFCLGRGISYPLALEAALKIKEVSYIHAEGFAGGELKHGPLALFTKGTVCIVFAPNDATYTEVISSAMEMKARGGSIIGVSPLKNVVFDIHVPIDDRGLGTLFPQLVVAQLLGYLLAIAKRHDPDMPRNLAKSVTVK